MKETARQNVIIEKRTRGAAAAQATEVMEDS